MAFPARRLHRPALRRPAAFGLPGAALALGLAGAAGLAQAQDMPTQIGKCVETTIAHVGTRLLDGRTGAPIPGSGSAVAFANHGAQVSYEEVPEITRSRAGDPVRLCLVSVPRNCPPGDDRGRVYRTTNLRTHESWTLPDSQHSCGGA
ncbi:MAG: hypothetical protein IRY87_36795 [Acetobacteraceae bacterium]|nr:hypothetical protein [Acetobacteraceae bacterium]